jgi:hypothetical protein
MGEKCPKCGGEHLMLLGYVGTLAELEPTTQPDANGFIHGQSRPTGRTVSDTLSKKVLKCFDPTCRTKFIEGDGGTTDGMCDLCIAKRNPKSERTPQPSLYKKDTA